jgi:hypothetical protein
LSAQIRYQNYSAFAPDGNPLFSVDFNQPVLVKQEVLHQLLVDMHSFTLDRNLNSNLRTQIGIQVNNNSLQIERNYATKQMHILPSADALPAELVGWRNEFILSPIVDRKILFGQIQDAYSKLGALTPMQSNANSDLKQRIVERGGELAQKYIELNEKLVSLEAELDAQRLKDESTLAQGDVEVAIRQIDESVNAVAELTQKHSQIKTELSKFSNLLRPDLDQQAVSLKQEMKTIRDQDLAAEAVEARNSVQPLSTGDEEKLSRPFLAKFMLLFPVILLVVGLLGYLAKHNALIIAATVTGALLQFGFIALAAWVPPEIDISELSPRLRKIVEANVPKTRSGRERMLQLEKFFLDKAWAQALLQEEQNYQKMIQSQLGDVSMADLQNTRLILESQLQDLAEESSGESTNISPEEYLRKRRELDMMRIDRSRAEAELRNLPDFDQLRKLLDEFEEGGSSTSVEVELGGILADYTKLKMEGQALSLFSSSKNEWMRVDLEVADLLAVWIWLRLNYWQTNPEKPLILAGILTKVTDTAKLILEQKISALSGIGQIVLVQTIA